MIKASDVICLGITLVLATFGLCQIWNKHFEAEAFKDSCKARGGLVVAISGKPLCLDKETFQNVREK